MSKVLRKTPPWGIVCLTAIGVLVAVQVRAQVSSSSASIGPIAPPNEIWIAPAASDADGEVGDWAVSDTSGSRFSFGVPANFMGFEGATVVLIGEVPGPPGGSAEITYDLNLSVSLDQESHSLVEETMAVGPITIVDDKLREIDVSAIFFVADTAIGGLGPQHSITLRFEKPPGPGDAQVIGLRFQFEGPVGPPGEPGEPGEPGPPGLTGYEFKSFGINNFPTGFGVTIEATVVCTKGKKVLGGGGRLTNGESGLRAMVRNGPLAANGNLADDAWTVAWIDSNINPGLVDVQVFCLCAEVSN